MDPCVTHRDIRPQCCSCAPQAPLPQAESCGDNVTPKPCRIFLPPKPKPGFFDDLRRVNFFGRLADLLTILTVLFVVLALLQVAVTHLLSKFSGEATLAALLNYGAGSSSENDGLNSKSKTGSSGVARDNDAMESKTAGSSMEIDDLCCGRGNSAGQPPPPSPPPKPARRTGQGVKDGRQKIAWFNYLLWGDPGQEFRRKLAEGRAGK